MNFLRTSPSEEMFFLIDTEQPAPNIQNSQIRLPRRWGLAYKINIKEKRC